MVGLGVCGACDLLIDDVHLEDSCFVVRKHSTVEEKLRKSEIHHPVVLCDDWVDRVVHQRVVRIRQIEKHPLQTQHTHCYCQSPLCEIIK